MAKHAFTKKINKLHSKGTYFVVVSEFYQNVKIGVIAT